MKTADEYAPTAGRLPLDEPTEKPTSAGLGSDGATSAQFRPAAALGRRQYAGNNPDVAHYNRWKNHQLLGRPLSTEELLDLPQYHGVPYREVESLDWGHSEGFTVTDAEELRHAAFRVLNCSPSRGDALMLAQIHTFRRRAWMVFAIGLIAFAGAVAWDVLVL